MTMERVARRMRLVAGALNDASIPYALVGGNAIAYWIATKDPSATRTTRGVDVLVHRVDLDRITTTLEARGLKREDLRSLTRLLDPTEPSRRSAVHLVWANEKLRPSYEAPSPEPEDSMVDPDGLRVLKLAPLVTMKLTSFRPIDQVHIADLLAVGLIDNTIRDALPPPLRERLATLEQSED